MLSIGRKISKKTCHLTQNLAQNDPINVLIKAFHFRILKNKNLKFKQGILLSPSTKYDFQHSLDAERLWCPIFLSIENPRMVYTVEEREFMIF